MKRALREAVSAPRVAAVGLAAAKARKHADRARIGREESVENRGSSSAFEAWFASYRGRLERLVKNAGRE